MFERYVEYGEKSAGVLSCNYSESMNIVGLRFGSEHCTAGLGRMM